MRVFISLFIIMNGLLNLAYAQDEMASAVLFGNAQQPGSNVCNEIQTLMFAGQTLNVSTETVLSNSLEESSTLLSSNARQSLGADKNTTVTFLRNMVTTNSLFEATKATIEESPENIVNIIKISIALYPDFAQEVINAAVMSGEMGSNEALLAAISAGADPTTVSEATAAGGEVGVGLAVPVGVGVGAGGSGGGDATASTN